MHLEQTETGKHPRADAAYMRVYDRWAGLYNLVFNWPFRPGRKALGQAVSQALPNGGSVLVAGVGTGLELEFLPVNTDIVGIDLSRPMLEIARQRVATRHLGHVRSLGLMDAGALTFGDSSFHLVAAPYLLSVAPSPQRVLEEMWRVTRVGGEVIILNHFSSERGIFAVLETGLERLGHRVGWRPKFPRAVIDDWLEAQSGALVIDRRRIAPFRLFTLVRVRKTA